MTEPRRTTRARRPTVGSIAPLGDSERLAELEARLARLERSPTLRERGRTTLRASALEAFAPRGRADRVGLGVRGMRRQRGQALRNAGREQLLGVRSIVDFWIRRLDEAEVRAARGRSRDRETIEIE